VANIKSAQKRARQAVKLRAHNMDLRSKLRTKIKNVINLIGQNNKEEASKAFKDAMPVIDSMVNKGIIKKNKAARHKSRLNKKIKNLV
tara:strand:+ start:105 stop:368 length:264 start_codon:yes stop_codon:yes gene_type:complete